MMPFYRYFLLFLLCAGLAACDRLPAPRHSVQSSQPDSFAGETRLERALAPLVRRHARQTGVILLPDGREAFAVRAGLIENAQRSIDVQYYIWHDDASGLLLLDALRRAADRGVKVRLLLDDNNTQGMDALLRSADQHRHIQVRLFNPFVHRSHRWWSYLTDFSRLNRRMHNKSFTVDGAVSILGGRNIGDEYFGLGQEALFVDLDALVVGSVVEDVTADFQKYWQSASSYPLDQVLPKTQAVGSIEFEAEAVRNLETGKSYLHAASRQQLVDALLNAEASLVWSQVKLISDDPGKGLGLARQGELAVDGLKTMLGLPEERMLLVSPYFVPTSAGASYLGELAKKGVDVRVLTNSLAATDVAVVHSGYAKWRRPLLQASVSLYEMKPAFSVGQQNTSVFTARSASSLHAKTFVVDSNRLFVGSFNFDPRSARLNTEMGLVIHNPELVHKVWDNVLSSVAESSYAVSLDDSGHLLWTETVGHETTNFNVDPGTGPLLRAGVWVLSKLPLDWLL